MVMVVAVLSPSRYQKVLRSLEYKYVKAPLATHTITLRYELVTREAPLLGHASRVAGRACDVSPPRCQHVTVTAVASISFPEVRSNFRAKKKRDEVVVNSPSARRKDKQTCECFSRASEVQGFLCRGPSP